MTLPSLTDLGRRRLVADSVGGAVLVVACMGAYAVLGGSAEQATAGTSHSGPRRAQTIVLQDPEQTVVIAPEIHRVVGPATVRPPSVEVTGPVAAAATPTAPAPAWQSSSYGAFATATGSWTPPVRLGDRTALTAPVAQSVSAAGAALGGTRLTTTDALGQRLLPPQDLRDLRRTAYAVGSPLTLTGGASSADAGLVARATSPSTVREQQRAAVNPTTPPGSVTALGGSAGANTDATSRCVLTGPLSEGGAQTAGTGLLPTGEQDLATVASGTSDSHASTSLATTTGADGAPAPGRFGVVASARAYLPELALFRGTSRETVLRFLTPMRLTAQAGGTPGSAQVSYAPVTDQGDLPLLQVTALGRTTSYTAAQLAGLVLPTPAGTLEIAAPATVQTASDGTSAMATVDLVRVLPSPGLGARTPALRLGHLEVQASAPLGGVRCGTAPAPGPPLSGGAALEQQAHPDPSPGSSIDVMWATRVRPLLEDAR